MRLAAFQPDNPYNLGAMIRLCACFATALDVIEPCGFPLSMRTVRQTALDYGAMVDVVRHENWDRFLARQSGRLVALSTAGDTGLWSHRFQPGDTILMGRESAGLPEHVHQAVDIRVRIPMPGGARSLNVAMAAAIALGEAMRQTSPNAR